ncbi:MAG: hypothetical protein EZS28_004743, partial [Streblomastix strix]
KTPGNKQNELKQIFTEVRTRSTSDARNGSRYLELKIRKMLQKFEVENEQTVRQIAQAQDIDIYELAQQIIYFASEPSVQHMEVSPVYQMVRQLHKDKANCFKIIDIPNFIQSLANITNNFEWEQNYIFEKEIRIYSKYCIYLINAIGDNRVKDAITKALYSTTSLMNEISAASATFIEDIRGKMIMNSICGFFIDRQREKNTITQMRPFLVNPKWAEEIFEAEGGNEEIEAHLTNRKVYYGEIIYCVSCLQMVPSPHAKRRKKLNSLKRMQVVTLYENGMRIPEISRKKHIPVETVRYTVKYANPNIDYEDAPRSGRRRKTTPREDRVIRTFGRKNRYLSAERQANAVAASHNINVSPQTVKNRLKEIGLIPRVLKKRPMLSRK